MKTIFVMVKCELGKAYAVADAVVADGAGDAVGGVGLAVSPGAGVAVVANVASLPSTVPPALTATRR